jgi:hypothetical protein
MRALFAGDRTQDVRPARGYHSLSTCFPI